MSAITSHQPHLKHVFAEVGEAMGVRSETETVERVAPGPATDADQLSVPRSAEPGAAASAVPVVASVGVLFGLAVGLAFGGRSLLDALAALLGG